MLIDDENLFHLVFEDACSILDMALSFEALDSSDEADRMFKQWFPENGDERPECVFVDLNIIGSSFDGIEMIRKVNYEYGDGVVIGIISSSEDEKEIEKANLFNMQENLDNIDDDNGVMHTPLNSSFWGKHTVVKKH